MPAKKISINMLSKATSVPGQGVGSAFLEQVSLVQNSPLLDVHINALRTTDITHIHSVNFEYFFLLTKNAKTVVYCHFLPETLDSSINLPGPIFQILKDYVVSFYKRAKHLVVVNPVFIEPLIDLGIERKRIHYIPNYVDQKDFYVIPHKETLKKKHGYKGFVVLGVGQVQSRKGVFDFVDVARRMPDVTFIWAGGFSFKGLTAGYEELKDLMDHPPKNMKFLGIIPREKMNELYNLSDVFFLPSFNELFPMSILEASQLDLPFLLRELPLYQPIFNSNYISGKSVDEFVRILQALKDDPEYMKQAKTHAQWVKTFYNKASVLKMWEQFYQEVAYGKK
jgi:1,2-diacylglycerol-3-alpha-glucose alpha-1,2-galactosyltransferase